MIGRFGIFVTAIKVTHSSVRVKVCSPGIRMPYKLDKRITAENLLSSGGILYENAKSPQVQRHSNMLVRINDGDFYWTDY